MPRAPRDRGFTLVELLAVIAIIGLLVALLIPAVQSARESARRAQCSSRIREFGLALLHYHTSNNMFPPGMEQRVMFSGTTPPIIECQEQAQSYITPPATWNRWASHAMNHVVAIMPFVDLQSQYDKMDFSQRPSSEPNRSVTMRKYPYVLCPSHPHQDATRLDGSHIQHYGGSGGTNGSLCRQDNPAVPSARPDGIFWANSRCSLAHVRDGASNTALVCERLSYYPPDENPDLPGRQMTPGSASFNTLTWSLPGWADMHGMIIEVHTNLGSGPSNPLSVYSAYAFHPGGINIALADGAVKFIDEMIDINVWFRLARRNDGQPLGYAF